MQGDFLVNTDRTEATKTEYSTKRVSNKGHPAPSACPCWGGALHKLGEDVTETLELVPRQWKVIQHVREKYSCRSCEKITQPPAHVLFGKYGLHLPLTRQSATYAREGVPLDVSTLTDWVGASAATLMPLVEAIRAHVFAAERIHADETTVPVLDIGKTPPGGCGPMCATTGRSPAPIRRRRPTSTRPTAAACTPRRGDLHPDRDRKTQRCRSASMAR